MSLDQELARTGRRLFRWRTWVPAALLLPIVLTGFDPGPGSVALGFPRAWPALCLALGALGLVARILTVGFVAADTSGRNTAVGPRAAQLNTTGAYSLVRHPIYAANLLLWIAPSLLPGRWWPPVIVAIAFRLLYDRIILAEESFLRDKFGAPFEAWAARTPPLWPFARGWRARFVAPDLPFAVRAVIRREYPSLLSFVVAMTAVHAALQVAVTGGIGLGRGWLTLALAAILAASVLRFLNHRTNALDAEGR